MAAPVNGREFFSLLEKSQLLDQEVINKLRPQMQKHQTTEPKRLATTLIKNQLISEYQARQILAGKYKGFYLARYKLLELLGAGGMGRVYLAEQISMERLVAIKLISGQKGKKRQDMALARFQREAKAVATLRHPNIIQAFDYADEHGMPYFVMEYVEGIDIARIVHRFGPIPWQQAAEYGRQAAEGLEHAHRAGLVHRDIKPGNLLVDSSGQIKVLDLGLVSAFDEKGDDSLTVDQDQLGTVDYIAPEQALDSRSVDARADIYGLGATLYAIMAGRILFPDKSTAQKLLMHQTTEPEPLAHLVNGIPAELAVVIHKMLAKKPEQRFQSAQEVAHALKPFAEPKSPPYELNAIKYRRATYEGFLGKCPDPSRITVPTLGSPEAEKPTNAPPQGASQMAGKLRKNSMISTTASDPALDDFSSLGDDYTQLAMDMPSIINRKKKRKRRKKIRPELLQMIAVVGSLLGLLLAAWLGSNALRATGNEDQRPLPIQTQLSPVSLEAVWRESLPRAFSDADLLVHYTFDESTISGDQVANQAKATAGQYPLKLIGPTVVPGRYPGKKSIQFQQSVTPQHAEISSAETDLLQLNDRFTISLWFKVDTFDKLWQTLICKGNGSWRIQRTQETRCVGLHLTTPEMAICYLDGHTIVDDMHWHHLVAVNSPQMTSIKLYLDGALDIEIPSVFRPQPTTSQVWLGEMSEVTNESRGFKGWIDEVAIWKRDLDPGEVKRLFTSGNPVQ